MREIAAELKALRLYGMAGAWSELTELGGQARVEGALWLIEHLLDAEGTDRVMRSIRYQMTAARFPIHRDLAGFDFGQSCVDRRLIDELADLRFSDKAHNVVLIGWAVHRQDASGHGTGGLWHHSARTAGAFLLDRGPGQCAGAGEGCRQVRADCPVAEECGSGDP